MKKVAPGTAAFTSGLSLRGLSPRHKRRISQGGQYAVLVGLALAVAFAADWGSIRHAFINSEVAVLMLPELFTVALINTVVYTVSGYVLGFFLGLLLALMRLSSVPANRWLARGYIELFRGLPALLVFLLLAFGVPSAFPGFQMPFGKYGTVALALGLVSAAYLAETFRAGIQAVPKGQVEAARSLGMSASRAMITVVLPQAIRIVIPPLTNELILLFKDSSLVYVIGVTALTSELAKFGSDMATDNANSTPPVVAGLTYLVITVPLSVVVGRLEAKQARAR
jgi:polar amino acid transport system permease protein